MPDFFRCQSSALSSHPAGTATSMVRVTESVGDTRFEGNFLAGKVDIHFKESCPFDLPLTSATHSRLSPALSLTPLFSPVSRQTEL